MPIRGTTESDRHWQEQRTVNKRTTLAEAIGEVRDGMTIGIGGWGARRKPMALVRALLRSPAKDLTVVS